MLLTCSRFGREINRVYNLLYLTVGRKEEAGETTVNIHACTVNFLCHITAHQVVLLCTTTQLFTVGTLEAFIVTWNSMYLPALPSQRRINSHSAALYCSGCCWGNAVKVGARRRRLQHFGGQFLTRWCSQSQEQSTAVDWWRHENITKYKTF